MFRSTALALALCLSLPAGVALASSDATLSPETIAAVTQKLTDEGYEVRSVQMEDGMIEVYAMKDGKKYEMYLDDQMNVVKSEMDD